MVAGDLRYRGRNFRFMAQAGSNSMRIKRLSHVSLNTCDLAATQRFYVDVLGFEIAHEFRNAAGERYGFFLHAGGGSFVECFQNKDVKATDGRFRHLCFEVDDIEGFAARLGEHGYANVAPRRGRTDGVLQFFILDPEGVEIEFQQHDDRSALKPFLPAD
jgi:catechol 2,3-dioxygenase-like lactoylglutathione lyase family enzyme